jgi:hypothetical protein
MTTNRLHHHHGHMDMTSDEIDDMIEVADRNHMGDNEDDDEGDDMHVTLGHPGQFALQPSLATGSADRRRMGFGNDIDGDMEQIFDQAEEEENPDFIQDDINNDDEDVDEEDNDSGIFINYSRLRDALSEGSDELPDDEEDDAQENDGILRETDSYSFSRPPQTSIGRAERILESEEGDEEDFEEDDEEEEGNHGIVRLAGGVTSNNGLFDQFLGGDARLSGERGGDHSRVAQLLSQLFHSASSSGIEQRMETSDG